MSEDLAGRIRDMLKDDPDTGEIRMFGGICFTLNGNMLAGVTRDGNLLARVGENAAAAALRRPGAKPMRMGERTMKGFVAVSREVLDEETLKEWLALSTALVGPMPPKRKKPPKGKSPAHEG